ncbi:MAG: preprotein translocase subunit SecE [Ruminococcaceae bacterium]|nr:preprotein translocase subunit SecE [Oscillospiraceae bacterium]
MSEKKPNIFVRAAKKIGSYFRELKSETKKVSWPSFKQVRNNTGIVIAAVLIIGAFIALISLGFEALVGALLNI